MLVISHDRYFLDHVCGRMAELILGTAETYTGNYTQYTEKRAEVYETRMKAWELQQKEIARQEAVIAMYRRFNREKSLRLARSREKRLEKIERLEKPQEEDTVQFRFDTRRRTGEDVLQAEGLEKSYGERILFRDVKMHIRAGDRIALIGDNGTGKTTLLRCLTGEEKPDHGSIRWGTGNRRRCWTRCGTASRGWSSMRCAVRWACSFSRGTTCSRRSIRSAAGRRAGWP